MQYTEDDMNDLFRKAAEDYSPKKGDSNWQNISDRITEHYSKKKLGPAKKTGISRKYIALIFLFISITGGWIIYKNNSFHKSVFSADNNKPTSTNRNNTTPYLSENNTSSLVTNPNQLKQPNRIHSQSKLKDNAAKSVSLFTRKFDDKPGIIKKYIDAGRQNIIITQSDIKQKEQDAKIPYSIQENNQTKSLGTSPSYVDEDRKKKPILK